MLNNRIDKIEEITNYLTYLKQKDIKVLPPDVNKSLVGFSVEGDCVRVGLAAVKGVGSAIMEQMVAERDANGPYKDLYAFLSRMYNVKLNSRMIESLIYSGAFDCFGRARSVLIQAYPLLQDRVAADNKAKAGGQLSMFDMFDDADGGMDEFVYPVADEYSLREKLRKEKEVTGVYLSGHPLQSCAAALSAMKYNSADIHKLDPTDEESEEQTEQTELRDGMTVTLRGMIVSSEKKFSKNGKEFGMGVLEDLVGTVEVLVAPSKWQALKGCLEADKLVTVVGRISANGDREANIWATTIEEWKDAASSAPKEEEKRICCYLDGGMTSSYTEGILDIARTYPGRDTLYIKDKGTGELYRSAVRLDAQRARAEMVTLLGEDNVRIA